MISVIIPTLGRIASFPARLKELSEHPLVGEILLIDNTTEGMDIGEMRNLNHIKEGKNTFINPAWNKGNKIAKYDKQLFLNDDVETDFAVIDFVYDHITPEVGMIGAGKTCWAPHYVGGVPYIQETGTRNACYASIFFMHRDSYIHIPEEMKVWYGDDWLFYEGSKPNLELVNWFMGGKASQTLDAEEFNELKLQDKEHYNRLLSE